MNNGFNESRISPEHYFQWRKKRAHPSIERVGGKLKLRGRRVLDIGCGYGALSSILLEEGSEVWATEANKVKLSFAKEKLGENKDFHSLLVENEILPFENDFFDAIFLFDVIEHVGNPKNMMKEVLRVLKPKGYLYVEFTPYYSITGHHLYDFAKWPIHLLPEKKIKEIIFSKKTKGFMTREYYWNQFKSLNKLRIPEFQRMVKKFKRIEERFILKYPEKFEINLPFINYLGPLKDYFTMSFEGFYQKK